MSRNLGVSLLSSLFFLLIFTPGCSRTKTMDRALRLEQQGRPDKALQLYESQLQKTPGSDRTTLAELQFRMGESFLAMDRAREAFSAFNRAIELDSGHREARLRLGEMYLMTGAADRAAEQAEAVLHHSVVQPSVDNAVTQNKPKTALDVAKVVPLEDHGDLGEGGGSHSGDPHVWLDPVDFRKVSDAVADALSRADPAHAADFRADAAQLDGQLEQLDADYHQGLASCQRKDVVTSHAAFGYLAERYGLTQVPIAGLSPEDEPSAAHLAQIEGLIRSRGVTTVFFETLASPKTAQSLAKDTGTKAAVLDPIEGIADPAGHDYLSVMRANLAALQSALGCAA